MERRDLRIEVCEAEEESNESNKLLINSNFDFNIEALTCDNNTDSK